MAETLIAAGVDINTPSTNGTHILPFSIINGRDQFALFLIERGADPNGSLGGIRALHAAVGAVGPWMGGFGGLGIPVNRRLPVVEALLARGADPNARITTSAMIMFYVGYPKKGAFETYACGTGDLRGATPLWVAAYGANGFTGDAFNASTVRPHYPDSSAEIIRTLLAAGAEPIPHDRRRHDAAHDGRGTGTSNAYAGPAARGPFTKWGGGGQDIARRGRRRQRGERGRLHRPPWRRVPRVERDRADSRGERRRHQRARLQGSDSVPSGRGLQAVVPVPGLGRKPQSC